LRISSTLALQAPFSAPTLLRGDLCESISRSAALGFAGVELQFKAETHSVPDADKTARVCEESNMTVCALATGALYVHDGLSLISDDNLVAEEALARLRLYVDFASQIGGRVIIGCVIGCVRGNIDTKNSRRQYLSRLAEGLLRLGEYGERRNVSFLREKSIDTKRTIWQQLPKQGSLLRITA